MTRIPDFMPKLRHGTGATPKDGGCLVQVAGWLNDGQSWTDKTPCVHPVLRSVAIIANDTVGDEDRQGLLPLAPRLIGTGMIAEPRDSSTLARNMHPQDLQVLIALGRWIASYPVAITRGRRIETYPVATYGYRKVELDLGRALFENWSRSGPTTERADDAVSHVMSAARMAVWYVDEKVQFLAEMLDEYDRITGRTESGKHVSEAEWRSLATVMQG